MPTHAFLLLTGKALLRGLGELAQEHAIILQYPSVALERKNRSELIAPIVRLFGWHALEGQLYRHAARGGASVDIAHFVYKRNPLVEPVSERSGIEVGAPQFVPIPERPPTRSSGREAAAPSSWA